MIKIKAIIEDIDKYQIGNLPKYAHKIETPKTTDEIMKKACPIAVMICVLLLIIMFIKTFVAKTPVVSPLMVIIGLIVGFGLLIVHELLHAVVYPKEASVTVGKLKGRLTFVALASYPFKRSRFILMCLFPFILGIIPLCVFVISPADYKGLNGVMFGMACMGMVSPFPDVFNVITVLRKAERNEKIMFYKDDMYKTN